MLGTAFFDWKMIVELFDCDGYRGGKIVFLVNGVLKVGC